MIPAAPSRISASDETSEEVSGIFEIALEDKANHIEFKKHVKIVLAFLNLLSQKQ